MASRPKPRFPPARGGAIRDPTGRAGPPKKGAERVFPFFQIWFLFVRTKSRDMSSSERPTAEDDCLALGSLTPKNGWRCPRKKTHPSHGPGRMLLPFSVTRFGHSRDYVLKVEEDSRVAESTNLNSNCQGSSCSKISSNHGS